CSPPAPAAAIIPPAPHTPLKLSKYMDFGAGAFSPCVESHDAIHGADTELIRSRFPQRAIRQIFPQSKRIYHNGQKKHSSGYPFYGRRSRTHDVQQHARTGSKASRSGTTHGCRGKSPLTTG